jgi:phosphate transport system substrate-binding protein
MVWSALYRLLPIVALTSIACGCGASGPSSDIRVDGSSTVFVLSEAVAEEFTRAGNTARVIVGQSGTGGGFQKFCRGEIDINDASRTIRPAEIEVCKATGVGYQEIPVAFDGIAVVVNPAASWITDITVEELRRLWAPDAQGKVTRWSHVRPSWPEREIHLYGAGVDSGTYDYFTEVITGKEGASRGDFTASEDDNVLVQGVAGDQLGLGFLPFAYYNENRERLKLVPVDNGKGGGPVAPSFETIRSATYSPLSRPLFIYVSEKSRARPEVQQFVDFYVATVGSLAEEVGYVELPKEQ